MSKWKKTPLGSIGEAFIGLTYKPEDISSNGIIVLRSGNIQHNEIDLHEIIRVNKDIKNKLIIRNNDILICSRNGSSNLVGKSALITDILEQMTFGAFMMVYRSHYNKYLHHFMQSPYFKRQLNRSATTTINQITKSMLDKIVVSLPPLEEQHKIASILDTVSEALKLRKQQLNELDLLVKSKFIEMFGDPVTNEKNWEIDKLGKLGELNRGVSKHRPRNDASLLNGAYPLIQTGEVSNTDLYIKSYKNTYSELGLKQSRLWKSGTLCITIAANIAQTSILTFDACFPDSIVGFNSYKKTNQIFIHFWFSFFQRILEEQAPYVAQKNINLKILNNLNVIVPPIELQNKFASFVQHVDKLKSEVQKSINQLQTLLDSLMQQYFE